MKPKHLQKSQFLIAPPSYNNFKQDVGQSYIYKEEICINALNCSFNEQESRRSLWCGNRRICNFEWAHTRLLWPSVTCATLSWKQVFIPHHHSKVDQSADTPQHVFSLPVGGRDSLSSVKSCSLSRSECTPAYALQKWINTLWMRHWVCCLNVQSSLLGSAYNQFIYCSVETNTATLTVKTTQQIKNVTLVFQVFLRLPGKNLKTSLVFNVTDTSSFVCPRSYWVDGVEGRKGGHSLPTVTAKWTIT